MIDMSSRFVPVRSAEGMPFWEGCDQGELRLQVCSECQTFQWFPRVLCKACGSRQLVWQHSDGHGQLVTYTVVRRPMNADLAGDVPYVLAVIELDEGVRMMTNIVDWTDGVEIGDEVGVVFARLRDGSALPVFRKATVSNMS